MEKEKQNFLNIPKSKHFQFNFHLTNYKGGTFIHDFLGMAQIPLIGKYNKNDYTFDKPICHVSLDCLVKDQKSPLNILSTNDFPFEGQINLPEDVLDKLLNIKEQIKHNKGSAGDDNNKKSKIFEFHPFKFVPLEKVCFNWIIGVNQTKKLYKYKPKKEEIYKNVIVHPWIFPEIDFSKNKRIINNIPCCLVTTNKKSVEMYSYSPKAINFNEIRSEYVSMHLKSNALCFSPNNMRLVFNEEEMICDFFLVFLKDSDKHYVFYYWVVNDMIDIFENIFEESQSIEQVLKNLEGICGNENEKVNFVKNIFGIK